MAPQSLPRVRFLVAACAALVACALAPRALAQDLHPHTPSVSGMPQGIPLYCTNPTVTSAGSGAWSNPATWSTKKVPGLNEKVAVATGHTVTYDAVSDAKIGCIEVRGKLAFKTDANTRLKVVTIMVLPDGALEIGTPTQPVAPSVTAEIVVADQPFDPNVDPGQIGNGIVGLGKVTMHGAAKNPTFIRFAAEPLAGQTTLSLERPVTGWKSGDEVVIPDTRQLRAEESGRAYQSQSEKLRIASINGSNVTLAAPLAFDHKGARDAAGKLEFLPHLGNLTRNVVVRSENPAGTRGHTIFVSHAEVDIRYAQFVELGRTKMGILNNTDFDSQGRVARMGTNQIGRYAVHFHHDYGPTTPTSNGYQFTLLGNSVDGSSKWGITIHRSHYGLIQDNVVYNTRGAGIVTEDGSESFNIFDHNFSLRTAGSRDAAPGNGYSSVLPNPGGDGSAFWFRGPNNIIRNNVGASAAESAFGMPVTALGVVRIPKFKGADTSMAAQSEQFDTERATVPEFSNNEAYGAIQSGVSWAWSGTISGLTVWHATKSGVIAMPTQQLVVDKLIARGDPRILATAAEKPVGVLVANYVARDIAVTNANIQGTRIGVSSPIFYGRAETATREGTLKVENGFFKTLIGVNVATSYVEDRQKGAPGKKAEVRSIVFEPLQAAGSNTPAEAISMNYGMPMGDDRPRDPLLVYDFNKQSGRNFKVYYSLQAPQTVAPCHETMPSIGGWVCQMN